MISCEQLEKFNTQLYILIAPRPEEVIKKHLSSCSTKQLNLIHSLLKKEKDYRDLKTIARKERLSTFVNKKILDDKKTELANAQRLFELLEKLSEKEKQLAEKELLDLHREVDDFAKIMKSRFWGNLFEVLIAAHVNNTAWLRKRMQALINLPVSELYFDYQFENVSPLDFNKLFIKVLKIIEKSLKRETEFKVFITNLSFAADTQVRSLLESEFNTNWSLTELRKLVKRKYYTRKYFGGIAQLLVNRATENEVVETFNEYLTARFLKDMPIDALWTLNYFYPRGKKKKQAIQQRLLEMAQSPQLGHQYILLQLVENDSIKKLLGDKDKRWQRPLFQIEREHYLSWLNNYWGREMAVYQLIRLGERTNELLFWLSI